MPDCRCSHGVQWYIVCPWCKTEADIRRWWDPERDAHRYTFWRNLSPAQVEAEIERLAQGTLAALAFEAALDAVYGACRKGAVPAP